MLTIPEWTILLIDLNGNPTMDISRITNGLTLELNLNDSDVLSFDMDLKAFEDMCVSAGVLPRNVLYPQRTEIKAYRNGIAKFGGIVMEANSELGEFETSISVTADSYESYFAKRLITKNYTNTDRSQIAWDAIDTVQSVTYGDLGVTQGVLATIFPSDLTCDLKPVKDILQLYTYAQPTTYDYEITPDKVFNTYERIGSYRPQFALVYGQNIVSMGVPRNSDTLKNKIWGLGSGIGEERLQYEANDNDSQAANRIVEGKSLYNSVVDINTLEENTEGDLEQSRNVLVLPNVVVSGLTVDLDVVSVGDTLPVSCEGSLYNNDINSDLRIYSMKINISRESFESITLNFYKPDAGGEV